MGEREVRILMLEILNDLVSRSEVYEPPKDDSSGWSTSYHIDSEVLREQIQKDLRSLKGGE